mmetsp:Transcript_42313/g.117055  ORF Transcript_42313/g.117055 Transcript_42313/m.117055 type:complete len:238 (+) Transcript_42313:520-1233(+)
MATPTACGSCARWVPSSTVSMSWAPHRCAWRPRRATWTVCGLCASRVPTSTSPVCVVARHCTMQPRKAERTACGRCASWVPTSTVPRRKGPRRCTWLASGATRPACSSSLRMEAAATNRSTTAPKLIVWSVRGTPTSLPGCAQATTGRLCTIWSGSPLSERECCSVRAPTSSWALHRPSSGLDKWTGTRARWCGLRAGDGRPRRTASSLRARARMRLRWPVWATRWRGSASRRRHAH